MRSQFKTDQGKTATFMPLTFENLYGREVEHKMITQKYA